MAAASPPPDLDFVSKLIELGKAFLPGGAIVAAVLTYLNVRQKQRSSADADTAKRLEATDARVYSRLEQDLAEQTARAKAAEQDAKDGWFGLNRGRDGWLQCEHDASNNETVLLSFIETKHGEEIATVQKKRLRPLRRPPDAERLAGRIPKEA